jgi:type 1 glutamine amidotransferase
MNKYCKYFLPLLFVILCLSLLISKIWAQQREVPKPSQEEIKKIEEAMPSSPVVKPEKPRKLLVFNLCQGFRHSSIPYWDKALEIMAQKTGAFNVVESNDLNVFKAESLKEFDAVCFNNTTGLKLSPETTPELCTGLMEFVKSGKGVIGIHAATDNFNEWPEAQEMMGGKFTGHPWGASGTWAIKIDEPNHPLMAPFSGKGFKIKDEIYRTEPPVYSREKQLVLMSLDMSDEATKKTSEKPTDADTGISWIKTWGQGRVFYCSLGHDHAVTWNPAVLEHYLRGIQFALGDLKVETKPKPATKPENKN